MIWKHPASNKTLTADLFLHTRFFIRKPFFCLNLNFLDIMPEIRLRFSYFFELLYPYFL